MHEMHTAILWCGFLGAWLLFAGPVFQAMVELREEDLEVEEIRHAMDGLPPPPRVSAWWWLVPPVALVRRKRRSDRYKREASLRMTDAQFEGFSSFVEKASGWMLVGAGGLLIAVKETYELAEGMEWPVWIFVLVVLAMAALGVVHCVARLRYADRSRRERAAALAERGLSG